jgi:hypothetical protein
VRPNAASLLATFLAISARPIYFGLSPHDENCDDAEEEKSDGD